MAGAIYPHKLDLADEIRDTASVLAATSRRITAIYGRLPEGLRPRIDAAPFDRINEDAAAALCALADELEAAP